MSRCRFTVKRAARKKVGGAVVNDALAGAAAFKKHFDIRAQVGRERQTGKRESGSDKFF